MVNTTYPSSFNNFCYHDNHCTVLLPDHPPKITDGVGHGSWNTGENKTRTVNWKVVTGVKHLTILLNEIECEEESVIRLKCAKCFRSYKSPIQELFLIFIQNNSYFKNIVCVQTPSKNFYWGEGASVHRLIHTRITYMFLGMCPLSPSLSQHFALSEKQVLMLV